MAEPTREQIVKRLIEVLTRKDVTEACRRDRLATICLLTNIMRGEHEWRSIWADAMAATGCAPWADIMTMTKH
jgi:hypothetical protein